ncbi:MAG: hypothetical protein RL199_8 [Pseudomonadota bacterium]|jgi:hypothetical protein
MDAQKLKAFAGHGAGEGSGKGGMLAEPGVAKAPKAQKETELAKKARDMMAKAVAVAHDEDAAGHEEMAEHLAGFDPEEDEAPSGVKDVGLWKRFVALVDPEGKGKELEHPYAVALALYWLSGGPLEDIYEHMEEADEEAEELEEDED